MYSTVEKMVVTVWFSPWMHLAKKSGTVGVVYAGYQNYQKFWVDWSL